jgi:hypothetical protein
MLSCSTDTPDAGIAAYVDGFLKEAPWLRRRVETIRFLDIDTVVRRTTLDVGIADVQQATAACPIFPDRPLVPLAMIKKDLLVDFDLRDRQGGALAVAPRDVDTFFAWSALCADAKRVLGTDVQAASETVAKRLRAVAFDFPDPADEFDDPVLRSWEVPQAWPRADRDVWAALENDDRFVRLLREFTFNFILMTQLDAWSAIQIVKFSYQQHLPYSELLLTERLGLRATELAIVAPSVGWARSYHIRIEAPEELALTDVVLVRVERDQSAKPSSAESYEARLSAESAQVYTTSTMRPAEHVVGVTMRVPIVGYLRAIWLTSVATAVVLAVALWQIDRVEAASQQRADAAVALLLVAPSLVAAYLVRPGEHAIASRLLRPTRYAIAASGSLSYVAAALLVLDWSGDDLRVAWWAIAVISALIAIAITVVVALTKRDLKAAAEAMTRTDRRTVVVLPLDLP